jgi:chemotaxis protein CheY-P-specific phosphatase CheC
VFELPTTEKLTDLVASILADATFVFVEPVQSDAWHQSDALCARVVFGQGKDVELVLRAAPALAPTLAANLLGIEPESDEARESAADAVGELANMLAGVLAVAVFGPETICRISIPEVALEVGQSLVPIPEPDACRTVLLTEDGHYLSVALRIEADA